MMKKIITGLQNAMNHLWDRLGKGMRAKLIRIFLVVKVIPLILVTLLAWRQIQTLGTVLRQIAVGDSTVALNNSATENIERLSTDTARQVAEFLYDRDSDLLFLARLTPSQELYQAFMDQKTQRLVKQGHWALTQDESAWMNTDRPPQELGGGTSTNGENNDENKFQYRPPDQFVYESVPLYDEITFVGLDGMEQVKVVAEHSPKTHYPLSREKRDVSQRANTYVKAETYFAGVQKLTPGQIYVSDVIGAYVGSNFIGMYTPGTVEDAAKTRGYDIPYTPQQQAYAGKENPNGQRFEGIIRWATPVADDNGQVIGYVTFALNHDHIMELVDHITPMSQRYTELPSAYEGNYAFIWDYQCRSICHPRHHSIAGYDPATGDPQIPWLEESIYQDWKASGVPKWQEFIKTVPVFDSQSRSKKPSAELTRQGLVGLDGRYLNNAPQCTGWMDLTQQGGSGSFYILWSGLYKLTTAAAIPYYTGQYAPSQENGFSRRGFGFVTIGADLDDFNRPAVLTAAKMDQAMDENLSETLWRLIATTAAILLLVVLIAIWLASWLTGNITNLIEGISRFRSGQRQFRFHATKKDEFATLADSFDEMADSIVASVQHPLCIIDMQQLIIYMNQQGLTLRNKKLEDVVGTPYGEDSVYPEKTVYDPILALEEGREAEVFYQQDRQQYLRGVANYFLSKDGRKLGYIVETNDVTEMVLEKMKTEEQSVLLGQIFSASPDLIWYMDREGRYLAVNPRFAALVGLSPDDFVGKKARDVFSAEMARELSGHDRKAIASKKPYYMESWMEFFDGHKEILDTVLTPIYESNGALSGLLGFARNVDVRVKMENELRSTQIELEKAVCDANQANQHKGEFLARMSHEIRTPMNAIIGIANIVQRKLADEKGMGIDLGELKGHVGQIEASSQHLLGLLNDILDISKIEAGKIELTEEAMDLPRLAKTVAGIIRPRCEEKNITFRTEFDSFDPHTFVSDSLRLRQVLINLLGNAVKFTPECGEIAFSIQKMAREEGRTQVRFTVKDNGVGIAPKIQKGIFQPFEQGSAQGDSKIGGTGLGLAISKRIVELFGGNIELSSEAGKGSTFSFVLWLRETDQAEGQPVEAANVEGQFVGKRLLLVDDVELNRVIVKAMLENTGIAITEAADGFEAIEKFKDSPGYFFDIVLMDVQMPEMDGYQAAMEIRALDRPDAKSVAIVALTANAFKEDIAKALNSGMNAHLAKPVEMETMLGTLSRFLVGQG